MNITAFDPKLRAVSKSGHDRARKTLEDGTLRASCDLIQTPAYVYDLTVVAARYHQLKAALPRLGIRYAVKANPHAAVLGQVLDCGALIDASSIGEVRRALRAGALPEMISFTGPGKRVSEIEEAIQLRIGHLVVESLHQAEVAQAAAARMGRVQSVLARISPATSPKGFGARMTGIATQFGIDEEDAPATLALIAAMPALALDGLHFYAGSNSLDAGAIGANMKNCADLALALLPVLGRPPKRLIFGSGFGVPYHDGQVELNLDAVAAQVSAEIGRAHV